MSKTKNGDKRSREDLDLFLLAMIDHGADTPYQLMTIGTLSQGATIPALRRLLAAGHVRQGEQGARGRNQYVLTRGGRQHLGARWQALLKTEPRGEIETILRTASLALLMGASKTAVKKYLLGAALLRKSLAAGAAPSRQSGKTNNIGAYAWMRQIAESKRLIAESVAIRKIATSLK